MNFTSDELIILEDALTEYEGHCATQNDPDLDDIRALRAKLSMMLEAKTRAGQIAGDILRSPAEDTQ